MEKLVVLSVMIVALGFVATGCGGGDKKPTHASPTTADAEPTVYNPADSK